MARAQLERLVAAAPSEGAALPALLLLAAVQRHSGADAGAALATLRAVRCAASQRCRFGRI